MKCILSKMLYRILPVEWEQPLLTSNGTFGVDELAVYRTSSNGGYWGGDAWQAFASVSGYDGHWSGNYGDEYSTWLYFYIYTKKLINVTGFSCYYPCTDSASDGGSIAEGYLRGSNDNSSWTTLMSHGGYGPNSQNNQTFENTNYYHYYRYDVRSVGVGHRDLIQVSSIRLKATYEDFV